VGVSSFHAVFLCVCVIRAEYRAYPGPDFLSSSCNICENRTVVLITNIRCNFLAPFCLHSQATATARATLSMYLQHLSKLGQCRVCRTALCRRRHECRNSSAFHPCHSAGHNYRNFPRPARQQYPGDGPPCLQQSSYTRDKIRHADNAFAPSSPSYARNTANQYILLCMLSPIVGFDHSAFKKA